MTLGYGWKHLGRDLVCCWMSPCLLVMSIEPQLGAHYFLTGFIPRHSPLMETSSPREKRL